ncbi:transcriptional regulator [Conexibacter arvalis]|uniref:OmpR/PhoB-type domain-containing protein n=1 Tax=Conexibacter arvalis TaxID=912552 RepID=A0A840II20_9ACTN|nr:transcriptional regulator [Conexibacter arvalis]MBB4663861.1 hypothetical protein [Conexibacter arvalis]
MREPIAASWARSLAAGVDPRCGRAAPLGADLHEVAARWEAHPLATAMPQIRALLGPVAGETAHLIAVSDADGLLLWVAGEPRDRIRAADALNFAEGAVWSEGGTGTNAIGTAIAADHAVQVFAAEHFNELIQGWTCAAAPVHDPDTREVVGAVDLTGHMSAVHPFAFACAAVTAEAIESHLRGLLHARDARLRSRYEERVGGTHGPCALVTPSGRVIGGRGAWPERERLEIAPGGGELVLPSGVRAVAEPLGREEAFLVRRVDAIRSAHRPLLKLCMLGRDQASVSVADRPLTVSRRDTEILALLIASPAGMTSEELAADLYGDDGQPGTARVQIHRLRRALGRWIDTDPYRLTTAVESDVARVQGLLDRGAVRDAAERYDGPLLPRSEAPGVRRERERLESWLRQAVMTAEEPEALWAWVQTPSGEEEMPAWKRLLADLDFEDPRRALAAARVNSLRAAYPGGRAG